MRRVFFFFQAEDGIRDYKVTGVQTCALPILIISIPVASHRRDGRGGAAVRIDRLGVNMVVVMEDGLPGAGKSTWTLLGIAHIGRAVVGGIPGHWVKRAIDWARDDDRWRGIVRGNNQVR